MDMKLELVVLPVSDVDRAKEFYAGKLGFREDTDYRAGEDFRVVQVTPPGSGCSIVFGTGMPGISDMQPGSTKGLHLVVTDIEEARNDLIERGIEVMEVMDMGGVLYAYFRDPEGNSWLLQQFPAEAP